MSSPFAPHAGWTEDDLRLVILNGDPPEGFDCGREAQNRYLYERAWPDHEARIATTRLIFVKGIFAAYLTLAIDAIELGSREKDPGTRYLSLPALKLAQLGVATTLQGSGLGKHLVGFTVAYAQLLSREVGCRYVTLHAQPDLEGWYARQGFVRNKTIQKRRLERIGDDPDAAARITTPPDPQ